jgi:hypothetical protein
MARSAAQKAAARQTGLSNTGSRENIPESPVTPGRKHLRDLLAVEQQKTQDLLARCAQITEEHNKLLRRVDTLSRSLHNTSRRCNRSVKTAAELRSDLRRAKHNTSVLRGRVNRRKAGGIALALEKARAGPGAHWMKGAGGIFTERSREMVRDLVGFKVAPSNMDGVIHTAAKGLGLELKEHISARQVGRMAEEGGIASDLQVASEIKAAKGMSSISLCFYFCTF